ncbi:MAG: site-specific DNA-methyltransferase [Bacteroidaceae bacterium]|nr:site-specific DNA-methyltransferase [Bacteroidaceae bacterium]
MARRKIDKAALASLIRDLKELSNEQKADLLQLLNEQKRYGLVWEEHNEEAQEVLSENIPVLVEDKSKAIIASDDCRAKISEPTQTPNHILIEGDNLHALTALTYTHEGKVDVIYIDPPYNTGKKDDFVFNDNYIDKEDSYRHSKWLSFMEKRLRIAKKLLSDRGVIFISIDDNEQANLKLLCDEVFGQNLFVTDIIWRSSDSSNHDAKQFSADYNNTLVYSKCEGWQPNKIARTNDDNTHYKNPDNDPNGPWFSSNVSSPNPRQNLMFDIISPEGCAIHAPKNGWRWSYETMQGFIDSGAIVFKDNGTRLIKKTYLKDQEGLVPSNIFWDIEVTGHNRNAKYELKKIFPEYKTSDIFKTPKPTKFIKRLLELSTKADSLVLDFFAGSGTTLHSAMILNTEDGGQRKCILINSNDEGICEEFTYERNKRVINGYTTPKGVEVAGLKDNNLRYYKVEFTERENCSANRQKLMQMATDMLCIKHDLYDEQKQFGSLKFKPRFARYFANAEKQMLVVYEPRAIEYIAKELRENPTLATRERKLIIYAYSDGAYAYNDEFEGLEDCVELIAMPDALNQAIRSILPPQKQDNFTIEEGGEE